jgi:anti-sigma regulatory factor (Ser/Thr protein kinase)
MTKNIRARSEDVRAFILRNIGKPGLSTRVAEHFSITRQAVNRHLQLLVDEGALVGDGNTRNRSYKLAATSSVSFSYKTDDKLEEDVVWRQDIRPFIGAMPENVLDIWNWAFTEMFNNAIDHSAGTAIYVTISKTALDTEISIADNGVGIFTKIQRELDLLDERQAIFELSKGKLTTDTKNHSGQGIFFTSRIVSNFDILSGGVYFSHEIESESDWVLERKTYASGTTVFLKVENHTARSVRKVMDQFSAKGSYGFNKTIVPVKLAKYGTDQLVSRSQAKRVLTRVELFSQVVFDFSGVDTIGQAFADQIFRVFAQEHPNVNLIPSRTNRDINGTIQAAIKGGRPGFEGENPS